MNSSGDHVALNSIAERQEISVNYLEHVFSILRKADLVKSIKGAQGGYVLTDRPENITVGSILRALEGNLSVVDEDGENGMPGSIQYCLKSNVWDKMNQIINEFVDSVSLEDLVDEYKKANSEENLMFFI